MTMIMTILYMRVGQRKCSRYPRGRVSHNKNTSLDALFDAFYVFYVYHVYTNL